jgi:hypothetical protein
MSEAAQTDPLYDLKYPVGRYKWTGSASALDRSGWIDDIAAVPGQLRSAVAGLSAEQADTPYREGGWTVRQVVHHVPDSHMNAFVRFKLGLTETVPVIKPYDEGAWALLGDVAGTPVETSLVLLEKLHERWVVLLRSIAGKDWQRQIVHPEMGALSLDRVLGLYAWHGRHHVAHVTRLRQRRAW